MFLLPLGVAGGAAAASAAARLLRKKGPADIEQLRKQEKELRKEIRELERRVKDEAGDHLQTQAKLQEAMQKAEELKVGFGALLGLGT